VLFTVRLQAAAAAAAANDDDDTNMKSQVLSSIVHCLVMLHDNERKQSNKDPYGLSLC